MKNRNRSRIGKKLFFTLFNHKKGAILWLISVMNPQNQVICLR